VLPRKIPCPLAKTASDLINPPSLSAMEPFQIYPQPIPSREPANASMTVSEKRNPKLTICQRPAATIVDNWSLHEDTARDFEPVPMNAHFSETFRLFCKNASTPKIHKGHRTRKGRNMKWEMGRRLVAGEGICRLRGCVLTIRKRSWEESQDQIETVKWSTMFESFRNPNATKKSSRSI
jgi:hypothetical protein